MIRQHWSTSSLQLLHLFYAWNQIQSWPLSASCTAARGVCGCDARPCGGAGGRPGAEKGPPWDCHILPADLPAVAAPPALSITAFSILTSMPLMIARKAVFTCPAMRGVVCCTAMYSVECNAMHASAQCTCSAVLASLHDCSYAPCGFRAQFVEIIHCGVCHV